MKREQLINIIKEEYHNYKWGMIDENFTNEDERELRELIRNEIAAIFFDLFKKRAAWK